MLVIDCRQKLCSRAVIFDDSTKYCLWSFRSEVSGRAGGCGWEDEDEAGEEMVGVAEVWGGVGRGVSGQTSWRQRRPIL